MKFEIKKLMILSSLSLLTTIVSAQSTDDLYKISFQTRNANTARSVGMGGAFTSLGADAASFHINPAGLGMYRSSEASLTPSFYSSSVKSTSFFNSKDIISNKEKNDDFRLNNIAAVFSIPNNNRGVFKGITFGMSYNSNFSTYHSHSIAQSSDVSILDYFGAQLSSVDNGLGALPDDINSSKNANVYRDFGPYMWGSILAYNTFLLDEEKYGDDGYLYKTNSLKNGDLVNPSQWRKERQMIDELAFGVGTNIGDIVYFGITLGARMYENSTESVYDENYVDGNAGNFEALTFRQTYFKYGSAFDFKIGATVEPISGFRLGVAYHAPTVTYITDEIGASMSSYFDKAKGYDASVPSLDVAEYKVFSPSKFLVGTSIRLWQFGILSVDYERVWYNKMELRGLNDSRFINEMVNETYKPVNNLFFGAELQPIKGFFIRGGYSIYDSPYKKEYVRDIVDGVNVSNELNSGFDFNGYATKLDYLKNNEWSAGIGFRGRGYSIDVTYNNSKYSTLPYRYFNESFVVNGSDVHVFSPSILTQEFRQSKVMLTLGFRF